MTATTAVPPPVAEYLAAVRAALADLPEADRDDLLLDVEASVAEAAGETDAPIAARLGRPERFAAELRAAAGLEPPSSEAAPTRSVVWRDAVGRMLADPRVAAARGLLRELAPIWWVARGYLAVAAAGLLSGVSWAGSPPWVPRWGSPEIGVALIALAVLVSVAVGLRSRRASERALRGALRVANVLLALAAVPVVDHLASASPAARVVTVSAAPSAELSYRGARVTNIYPYSRDGRLLHDVLLYDGSGQPLDVGRDAADPLRRVLRTRAGSPLFHSFPIRYFTPGTLTVDKPNAGPRVRMPRIATPRLVRERRR